MTKFNEKLEELRNSMIRKKRLEDLLKDLKTQQKELTSKVYDLEREANKEQLDVDKLEGKSLSALYYSMIGKKGERLEIEKQEAYLAKVKYDTAADELRAVDADIKRYESELQSIKWSKEQYEEILQEKEKAIKATNHPEIENILQLEEKLVEIKSNKKELNEAISAGHSALSVIEEILSSLDSAEGWGTWDLFGGGILTDLAKHSHLDDAQNAVNTLQIELRRFKTELADVEIKGDMKVNIDGFLRFADYFFDGLFADWTVLDKINQSQTQVEQTKKHVINVINRLNSLLSNANQEYTYIKHQLEQVISKVDM